MLMGGFWGVRENLEFIRRSSRLWYGFYWPMNWWDGQKDLVHWKHLNGVGWVQVIILLRFLFKVLVNK